MKSFGRRRAVETPHRGRITTRTGIRSNAVRLAILAGAGVVILGAAYVGGPAVIGFLILP